MSRAGLQKNPAINKSHILPANFARISPVSLMEYPCSPPDPAVVSAVGSGILPRRSARDALRRACIPSPRKSRRVVKFSPVSGHTAHNGLTRAIRSKKPPGELLLGQSARKTVRKISAWAISAQAIQPGKAKHPQARSLGLAGAVGHSGRIISAGQWRRRWFSQTLPCRIYPPRPYSSRRG